MHLEFQQYIEKEKLFSPTDKIILAVSGGVDSMVMMELFRQLNLDFVVAHCNFRLRGHESDADEIFMRDYCGENAIELFVNHFDTLEYAKLEGISIEMAARELRYNWFNELIESLQYDLLATAHHQDDLVETMLINLSRGTGIRGLSGIQPKTGKIIRPLLFANRIQIMNFASSAQISFREDSSNEELVYQRNLIRHKIIPLFEEINPAFRKNLNRTASILRETESIYQQKIEEEIDRIIVDNNDSYKISIDLLSESKSKNTVLFELLHPKGFNNDQVREIIQSLDGEAGKTFFSKTHRLVKDRKFLLLTRIEETSANRFYIEEDCLSIENPISLSFEHFEKKLDFRFSTSRQIAEFDADLLKFPLIIKKWDQGEYFQPLGMEGFKKISDFFVDEKISIPQKENTWILYSGSKVVWIIGKRMDNRFKITENTQKVFRIIYNQ
ncbi:tRNA lysidine(34) synthetase TilS [Sunxiuqinia sp. A32]|uniref:tRNA lysidine(34) synthetase TilS n=1 Tax=Sunxiuqinia sp. A32 TaxID=3461496 RepID=UPI0040462546